MRKKNLLFTVLLSTMLFMGCGNDYSIATIEEEPAPEGVQVESSGDAIKLFLDGIDEQEQYIYCYTTDSFDAQEITSAINRKAVQAKKTYDMCNIKGCVMRTTKNENYTEIEIEMRYYMSREEYEYVDMRVETIAPGLQKDTDYETYKAIYEWVCTHVAYDHDTANGDADRFSAYDALKEGKAVCYGYAALYQRFCDELGLECVVLTSLDDTAHAWNVVTLNGEYYHVDSTFGTRDGQPDYNYFLCGKDKITYGSGYGISLAKKSYEIT